MQNIVSKLFFIVLLFLLTSNSLDAQNKFITRLKVESGNFERINTPDHYHHMGMWNPWTKTHYKGQQIDFWNLNLGQGTVRFAGFNYFSSEPVFGGFSARHEHIAFLTLQTGIILSL